MFKKIIFFSVFLVLLSAITIYQKQTLIINFLGEKMFLNYHQNNLAIKILSLNLSRADYYTHFLLGRIYFVNSELRLSKEHYDKSIELNPEYKESYYGRGLTYGFLNILFLDDAARDFQKYIEIEEDEFRRTGFHAYGAWAGYNDLAWVYFLMGDFINAERIARVGLKISTENPWLLNMLAISLIEQNNCKDAEEHLNNAFYFSKQINTEEFGEAYSGDNRRWWANGLLDMQSSIRENLKICGFLK